MKIENEYAELSAKIEDIVLRVEVGYRGGGIEIDLEPLGFESGDRMTAYQNYLGGGLLSSIGSDCNVVDWRSFDDLLSISEQLKKYFFSITPQSHYNDDYDDIQNRPLSAY